MAVPTKRRDRGASLVEFALLAPLLFLLLIGTLTGGLTLSRQNSVKNAVREASRFGAVVPDFDDTGDNLDALYNQLVAAATNDLDPGVPGRRACVALIDADDTWDYRVYLTGDTADASGTDSDLVDVDGRCTDGFDATVGTGTRRIWVAAQRTSDIEAILYSQEVTLQAASLSRYER